jgi:hypothetical protein
VHVLDGALNGAHTDRRTQRLDRLHFVKYTVYRQADRIRV